MREMSLLDVAISAATAIIGSLSLGNAYNIWRNRNGGVYVRALCANLASFGFWSFFILAETLYPLQKHVEISTVTQVLADIDRLILIVPQAILVLFVIPKAKK